MNMRIMPAVGFLGEELLIVVGEREGEPDDKTLRNVLANSNPVRVLRRG